MSAPATGQVLTDDTVGTITLGGDLTVRRLGFGAMRISGARNSQGVRDRAEAIRLVRSVVDRGVNFIDTANIYGYGESEEVIAEALHPYADGLVIASKSGFKPGKVEPGKLSLPPLGTPEHIKQECDKSLVRLKVDCIDLYQVHVPDPDVPYEDTVGAFVELHAAGKIRHIGVSNVSTAQLALAQSLCTVVSVQNRYNLGDRSSQAVLGECESQGIAFLPWAPIILAGSPAAAAVAEVAASRRTSDQAVALAWLLASSSVMLPIPGTSSVAHAQANLEAAWLELSDAEVAKLNATLA